MTKWGNAAGGDWSIASNWVDGAVPTAADRAVFGGGGAYTVSYSGDSQVARIRIVDGKGLLAFTGNQSSLTVYKGIAGAGPGSAAVELTSFQSKLDVSGSQTINDVTIDIGNSSYL